LKCKYCSFENTADVDRCLECGKLLIDLPPTVQKIDRHKDTVVRDSDKTQQATRVNETHLALEDALVGHTLGAYQLVERLGQGGMASVYKAFEPALDRHVAIKILPQFFAQDPEFIERFRREAKAVANLSHPNIVPIYSYGEEGNHTYIAMQYVEGGTLKQSRGEVYRPDDALRLSLPIVKALAYAHQRGIVHRDIKPSNVLMSEGQRPLLADFGLAKMVEASVQLTGTGVGMGTPAYMSPEQGEGKHVDRRTDIYSLGIMLYEMLTGDVPFRADTPMAVVIKHMTAPMPIPRSVNPNIPEVLERIILKATAKNPHDRYQSADEMAVALESAQKALANGRQLHGKNQSAEVHSPLRQRPSVAGSLRRLGQSVAVGIGIVLIVVILMRVFDVCLPQAPFAIFPWCQGSTLAPAVEPNIADGELGAILFQDDFVDEISPRWMFTASPHLNPWQTEKIDGRTVVRSTLPQPEGDMNSAEIRGTVWENYALQFDFRFDQPDQFGQHYFWLRGRITDCPPTISALQAYTIMVSPDKSWIEKSICQEGANTLLLESDLDITADQWHTLQYMFIGNRLQVYIDGEQFLDYTDSGDPLEGGDLWIETSPTNQILFDNFKVYEIVAEGESSMEASLDSTLCGDGFELLLFEDFETGPSSQWIFRDAAGAEAVPWEISVDQAGGHSLIGDSHLWAYSQPLGKSDILYRLRMRKESPSADTHINFGVSPEGRYYLSFGAEMILYKDPTDIFLAKADSLLDDLQWHEIEISVRQGQIQVQMDGDLRIDYVDPSPMPAGDIALENLTGSIFYDDILVCAVSGVTE
jgi:serine/threonine protein kinase